MEMRFEPDDERAYFTRRDELGEQFAHWLNAQGVPGDPDDAGLLMDWKWGYGDGALDHWHISDVSGFLFDWCVRKLSAAPAEAAEIPVSVAAFVEFLAHTGLLHGGDPPARIRKYCEQQGAAFVREMGNPANFGMAKSLFGFGDQPGAEQEHEAIGPIRIPPDAERLASAAAAPMLATVRELAGYCAAPGRTLTAKGNLRLADARRLVELLETGDDPTRGGARALTSAEDLPELSRIVDTAIGCGAVRRHQGKLMAVARFAGLDDVRAHAKLVPAALAAGRSAPHNGFLAFLEPLTELVDDCVLAQLAALLSADTRGVDVDGLTALSTHLVESQFGGAAFLLGPIPERARRHVELLADLGMVTITDEVTTTCADCHLPHVRGGHATLTAAGVAVAAELVTGAGFEVLELPDPATADAAAMVDQIGDVDEDGWHADIAVWFAAQPDPAQAADDLIGAALAEHRDTITALTGLQAIATLVGEQADELVRPHLGGPHDGVLLNWMIDRSAVDPATIDPARLMGGLIDMLAAGLDRIGPDEVVTVFGEESPAQNVELLGSLWRLDHPRLADVLEALGSHHPTKAVAKAARKSLVRHRSMVNAR